jgi:hypothetical protein
MIADSRAAATARQRGSQPANSGSHLPDSGSQLRTRKKAQRPPARLLEGVQGVAWSHIGKTHKMRKSLRGLSAVFNLSNACSS